MSDLIKRLEEATEGSRELDRKIAILERERIGDCADDEVPHYTTSLDAALTLVPEGHAYSIRKNCTGDGDEAYCNAQVWPYCTARDETTARHWANSAESQPALALCIASLKAREALSKATES